MWGGTKRNDPEGAIRAAIDHGINLIDTAPMYGYGRSEELVGEALKGVRVRSCSQPSAAWSGTKKKARSFSTRTRRVGRKAKRTKAMKFISTFARR